MMPDPSTATAATTASSLRGVLLDGRYRIDGVLGVGGMGAVFEAENVRFKKRVAVKLLHPEFARDPKVRERFLREARASAEIDHPNVVQVFDVGEHEGVPYLTMELLRGESLEDLLRRAGPLSEGAALAILVRVLKGLEAVHAKGFVHRDLKPANIFLPLGVDGEALSPKILDFGIAGERARDGDDASGRTRTRFGMGTAVYMPLEQMRNASEATIRSDLYAVGVTLFEMLTGSLPYEATGQVDLAMRMAQEPPRPIEMLCPNLDPRVASIVRRCLAREPDDRPSSATELLREIQESGLVERASLPVPVAKAQPTWAEIEDPERTAPGRSGIESRVPAAADPFAATAELRPSLASSPSRTLPQVTPASRSPELRVVALVLSALAVIGGAYLVVRATRPGPEPTAPDPEARARLAYESARADCTRRHTAARCLEAATSLLEGHGVGRDEATAMDELESLCTRSHDFEACRLFHVGRRDGTGRVAEPEAALRDLEALCGRVYQRACVSVGWSYEAGIGAPVDAARALSLYQRACDGGEMVGCDSLGRMYANGHGVPVDAAHAVALYQRACDGGSAGACSNLGRMYANGIGVSADVRRAVSLYQRACDGDAMLGCNNLGLMYASGRGVAVDAAHAASLFDQACRGRVMLGCSNLGLAYARGRGVRADPSRAATLYQRACDGGVMGACSNLGSMFESGRGVAVDVPRAITLYQRGCDGGAVTACFNLGLIYELGRGVAADAARARELYRRACAGGNREACDRASASRAN